MSLSGMTETAVAEPALSAAGAAEAGKLEDRYEFKPFRYSSHYWILKALEAEKSARQDSGCGNGQRIPGKNLDSARAFGNGIEFDAATAEKARATMTSFRLRISKPLRFHTGGNSTTSCLPMCWNICAILRRFCAGACRRLKNPGKLLFRCQTWRTGLFALACFSENSITWIAEFSTVRICVFYLSSLKELMGEVSCRFWM